MCEVVLSVLPFVAFVVTRLCQAQADYLRSWISILESKLCDSGSACEFCWACCYGVSDGLLGGPSLLLTRCEQVIAQVFATMVVARNLLDLSHFLANCFCLGLLDTCPERLPMRRSLPG